MTTAQYLKMIWFDVFKRKAVTPKDKDQIMQSELVFGLLCVMAVLVVAILIRIIHYI